MKRYQGVGNLGVSQIQLDLAATKARSTAAELEVMLNKKLAAEAQVVLDNAITQTAAAEVLRSEAARARPSSIRPTPRRKRLWMDV